MELDIIKPESWETLTVMYSINSTDIEGKAKPPHKGTWLLPIKRFL